MRLGRLSALIAAFIMTALVVQAQTLPPGVQKGPSLAGITEYSYPNGLNSPWQKSARPEITVGFKGLNGHFSTL